MKNFDYMISEKRDFKDLRVEEFKNRNSEERLLLQIPISCKSLVFIYRKALRNIQQRLICD